MARERPVGAQHGCVFEAFHGIGDVPTSVKGSQRDGKYTNNQSILLSKVQCYRKGN
jgi:hypothetical protein